MQLDNFTEIDIANWDRQHIYNHFLDMQDPYFGLVVPVDVSLCYQNAKNNKFSFFTSYLHKCMLAINETPNMRLRIIDGKLYDCPIIDCSTTIFKSNKTFGISYIEFSEDYNIFHQNFLKEQERIENTNQFLPDKEYSYNCIHCSALPWINFIGHKEPRSGKKECIPKLGFSKTYQDNEKLMMNISIDIHHGLVDGYHVAQFFDSFQEHLNI